MLVLIAGSPSGSPAKVTPRMGDTRKKKTWKERKSERERAASGNIYASFVILSIQQSTWTGSYLTYFTVIAVVLRLIDESGAGLLAATDAVAASPPRVSDSPKKKSWKERKTERAEAYSEPNRGGKRGGPKYVKATSDVELTAK